MIKINLLPANLYEAKVVRNIGIAFGVLAVVIAGGMFAWNQYIAAQTKTVKEQADQFQALSQQADGIRAQAASMRSGIAPIVEKTKFFDDVKTHNETFIELYSQVAMFTYSKVKYTGMSLSPDGSLQIQANAPSIGDIGRYWLNMCTAKHLFASVVISAAPTLENLSDPAAAVAAAAAAGAPPSSNAAPPSSMYAPPPGTSTQGTAPTTATAGIGAIERSQDLAKQAALIKAGKYAYRFTVQCALSPDWKTKITPPTPPGAAPGAPGTPGAPGAPAM
jgi:hypothetical protein